MTTNNAINLPLDVINYTNFIQTNAGGLISPKDTIYTLASGGGISVIYAPLNAQIQIGQSFQIISGNSAGWQLVIDSNQTVQWNDHKNYNIADGNLGQKVSSNGSGSDITATTATFMYVGNGVFVITSFTGSLTVA